MGTGDEGGRWGLARPPSEEVSRTTISMAGLLIALGGLGGLVAAIYSSTVEHEVFAHPGLLLGDALLALFVGSCTLWLGTAGPAWLDEHFPELAFFLILGVPLLISTAQFGVGPISEIPTLLYVEVPIFASWLLRRSLAVGMVALVVAQFAVVVLFQPGYRLPVAQVQFFAVTLGAIAYVFSRLIARGENEALRLAGLRRFLSQPVADAIAGGGARELLEPHRGRIAVFFVDLRGFTRFSSTAEPEEVLDVLEDYFSVVGKAMQERDATVGMLAGDGIMAFFGDPIACDDASDRAVSLAQEIRPAMLELAATWQRRGFDISYGVGIAYGYATLGVVGFDGRNDYTAIGSVVNLAARLSDRAGPGETLLDGRALESLREPPVVEPRDLELKGFAERVTAYVLADRQPAPTVETDRDPPIGLFTGMRPPDP